MLREIVVIDEAKCDGCGLCEKACAEGAIKIINGKARLLADFLCDGMGMCLGHCPRGAITIEKREAMAFDEVAVETHLGKNNGHASAHAQPAGCPSSRMQGSEAGHAHAGGGCPGTRFARFDRPLIADTDDSGTGEPHSELTHWPVQLRLLNPMAPVLRGAELLVAADCVPIAYPDFHRKMLRGKAVVIACPKLDETSTYVDKLAEIFRHNRPVSVTVAHMEVPCCTGILRMVLEARQRSGVGVPVIDVVVSIRGDLLRQQELPAEAVA
ncbi:MAG TPA: 4Fe-4S dicluster domain-containing protein [Phycisphaerae bacterium]|nr:4Fe-4S dicluster domain-containing protein [Phycisphaerae bacterium]